METETSHDELDVLSQQAQELYAKFQARENELAQARKESTDCPNSPKSYTGNSTLVIASVK